MLTLAASRTHGALLRAMGDAANADVGRTEKPDAAPTRAAARTSVLKGDMNVAPD